MRNYASQKVKGFLARNHRRKIWQRVVSVLSCGVVFCITYALILPAITMEKTPTCGKTEHTHTEACYTQVAAENRAKPICTLESLQLHKHTEDCVDESGKYICGYADFAVHEHDTSCFEKDGNLWCLLPEVKAHSHDESCYTQAESEPVHTHTEECYLRERGELICTESTQPHVHSDMCYMPHQTLACQIPESDGHQHSESCRDEDGKLICNIEESEGHYHGTECYSIASVLTCPLGDQPHQHSDGCYSWNEVLNCDLPADPVEHEEAPAKVLTCDKEEIVLHRHTLENCFETDEDGNTYLVCDQTQVLAHVHTETCFQSGKNPTGAEALTCTVPEGEGAHVHSEEGGCYDENGALSCQVEESDGHRHSPLCYGTWELTCQLEEHTHSAPCSVIGMISELPTRQGIEERMAELLKAGDDAGSDAYLAELQARIRKAQEAYDTLTEEQRKSVINADRLTELEWLCGLLLENPETLTVTNGDGLSAEASEWTPTDPVVVRKNLNAALVAVGQGYTPQEVGYYRLTGLTTGKITVTYNVGGLSAANDAEVFVYDLGADGMASPQKCNVEILTQDEQAGLFKSFSFNIPSGAEVAAHIYAFISATPATLEEMGIYCGQRQPDGTWIAYDAAVEADAGVKATIILPDGVAAPDGYRPFIRKINEGEGFYPKHQAVLDEAGRVNGWQCYTIRWIMQDESGLHMRPLNELGDGSIVTVKIDYLKPDTRLPGPAGARKLLIFNSARDGSLLERVADLVQNVHVDDNSYTSFTFQAAHSGPYVFVSKTLEKGYIEQVSVESLVDGSAPFDATGDLLNETIGQVDRPGNDHNGNNRVVRSYDTIQYNLAVTFAARQETVTEPETKMYFELVLGKSATAARFAFDKMLWLGNHYGVEYLNSQDEVIMVMDHAGGFYEPLRDENGNVVRDESGFALPNTDRFISFNSQISGSLAGSGSYKVSTGGIAKQRLSGWTIVKPKEGQSSALAGTQSFTTAVEVRNADNGEVFAPTFHLWLDGNEENYGKETANEDGTLIPATPDDGNVLDIRPDGIYAVTVSAGTNFNVQLKKNNDMSYKNWFDFSTGNLVAEGTRKELVRLANLPENHGKSDPTRFTEGGVPLSPDKQTEYANYRYGRITCYGITLQLYTDTDNAPDANRAAKGLKGMSLPVGDITFDLNVWSEAKSKETGLDESEYTAILWDYNENVPANTSYKYSYVDPAYTVGGTTYPARGTVRTPKDGLGNGGRNLYWDGETRSPYAKGGGPSNYRFYHDGCYYGGDWALVNESGSKVNIGDVATPGKVTGTGRDATYHFKVRDYDFDFDTQHFPLRDAGNSGNITGYDTYARCFSAGCVQVLSVFPMVQKVSEAEIFLNSEVSNLHLTTRAGQELKAQPGDISKIQHEVNAKDNTRRDQIVLYAPGNLTKGNSFNGKFKGNDPKQCNEGFLGTEYWTTSFDCSTFAGDSIWIISYGMMASGSDYRTRSMNLLQLFDSRALSIRGTPDVTQNFDPNHDEKGTAAFLYAADPDYPEGYDTNKDGLLEYMNTVREEDLVYSREMPDADGNITVNGVSRKCVGVLMELRGCNLLGGKYQYMRIPVKVNGDDKDLVSRTVATVNTFRVWSYDLGDVTWADGVWDETIDRNTLENYEKPLNGIDGENYSGELANGGKSPPNYIKTEYEDGMQVSGTHAGGTLAGNSLLILSYKANVHITVDNKSDDGAYTYHQGYGETEVDYRLTGIIANISDLTGQQEVQKTTLKIRVDLDDDNKTGKNRIVISDGSFRMRGYASVDEAGNPVGAEEDISISSNSTQPTSLFYRGTDGYIYGIQLYAVMGPGNKSVSFVLKNAPVGIGLPDITFKADFASVEFLENNDTIKTSVYISGEGDQRAYSEAEGNASNVTVGVVVDSGTNLSKSVDVAYIELNGVIEYTITYANRGNQTFDTIFFYDLLPNCPDIRGSQFDGDVILGDFGARIRGEGVPPKVKVYYSKAEYQSLYDTVKKFGGQWDEAAGNATGMDSAKIKGMLEDPNGIFNPLGTVVGEEIVPDDSLPTGEALRTLMSEITGLYVQVDNLGAQQSVDLIIKIGTKDNKAGDSYKNIANSWISNSSTLPLVSNKVQTQVVSRTISGVVWYDRNLNGVRDDGEPLLKGVTATLFKKGAKDTYTVCTKNVLGSSITGTVTTGENGAYSFDKLPAGEYIVAFSGDVLNRFTGATTYQQGGGNRDSTSDGMVIANLRVREAGTNEYKYYIRYSSDSPSMSLHKIEEMGSVRLTNSVELYENQDLGLIVAGVELPDTGGSGTILYTMVGLLMICGAVCLLYYKQRHGKEDFASS